MTPVRASHPTYGGPARTARGLAVRMHRNRNRVRWYAVDSRRPIGPEQSNVAPAVAYALAHGWTVR